MLPIKAFRLTANNNCIARSAQGSSLPGFACALIAALATPLAWASETVLHSFIPYPDGANPFVGVCSGPGGKLYGATFSGDPVNAGVVYYVDAAGRETVVHAFTGGADGGGPVGVVCNSAGHVYGAADYGGSGGAGVVFRLEGEGNETVLYSFTGGADGGGPTAGVILDSAGNLYGTTYGGGAAGAGVVFKLDPSGHETLLYTFTGGADGGYPYAGVILDLFGNLYGTTNGGGNTTATNCVFDGCGVVFEVDRSGKERVLYAFGGGADGSHPYGGVIQDSAGNLYSTTGYGGAAGVGVVFKVDPAGHETVLFGFPGTDGSNPWAGVIQDSARNLYGTTYGGGSAGAGMVYKLDPDGHETVLYNFTGGADGANPYAGVILDAAGNLYGTTSAGGAAGAGVVFKLDPIGHETVLYSFTGGADGGYPVAGVIRDSAGNLYGTTNGGGSGGTCFGGCGIVFKLDPSGHETVLHSFTGADGANPFAGVTLDAAGNLYGTTSGGGTGSYCPTCPVGDGTVYKLDTAGHETVLYNFDFRLDGGYPLAGVILDAAGNIYGNTYGGGPPATGSPGVVYKVDPTGHETVLYGFAGTTDGNGAIGNMIRDSAGNLYGATEFGGSTTADSGANACFDYTYYGCGVVFKVDTTGHETVLYTFASGADGGRPKSGVTGDSAGNLYGTTLYGGAAGAGVVFKITPGTAAQPASADPPVPPPHGPPFPRRPLPPAPSKGPLSIPSKGM
jgi:uncharacterized repeat protein (TIGR03803 family)